MANGLEPAGVNLEARGFKQYLDNLKAIDKAQKEAFDRNFSGTDKSYKQIIAASKQYERQLASESKALQRNERDRQRVAEQAERAAAQQQRAADRAKRDKLAGANAAFVGTAVGLGVAAAVGFDLAAQGAQFEAQEAALANLAGSYGQVSSEITAAMQRASNGVLSNSAIMQAANKALLLEVAQTPEEFERVTRNAIVLGRTLGLTATDSIDQFTTALGRKSLLILDNFGIKMEQVNRELDRLGRQEFGVGLEGLSSAQKDALFVEAALSAADKFTASIGDNADSAAVQIERMGAGATNAKDQFGLLLKDLGQSSGLFAGLADATQGIADTIQGARVGFGGGSLQDDIAVTRKQIEELQKLQAEGPADFGNVGGVLNQARAAFAAPDGGTTEDQIQSLQTHLDGLLTIEKNRAAAVPQATAATEAATEATEENTEALKEQDRAQKQLQQTVRQAEGIALNFARAQEDAARKFGKAQARLDQDQTKARNKLFERQQKDLDKFEADAVKDRAKNQEKAVKDEAKLRKDAAKAEVDEQKQSLLKLKQDRERFELDRTQSTRRFALSDRRLRAEGDILGLQALREDFELQQQENKENFDLQNRQEKDSNSLSREERKQDNEAQLADLRENLAEQNAEFETAHEERRVELLARFDEEEAALRESQQEQRDQLQESYNEQLEDLQRNRDRQLEDLGRSLVDQENLTAEGAQKIADQLERAFGEEGTADTIMSGFAERNASKFQSLFDFIGTGLRNLTPREASDTAGTAPSRTGRQSFDLGGPVRAPLGAPVDATLHGGEYVLSPQQQTQVVRMLAPVMSSQNVNLRMSGNFGVTGSGSISDSQVGMIAEQVTGDITATFEEMVSRLARQQR